MIDPVTGLLIGGGLAAGGLASSWFAADAAEDAQRANRGLMREMAAEQMRREDAHRAQLGQAANILSGESNEHMRNLLQLANYEYGGMRATGEAYDRSLRDVQNRLGARQGAMSRSQGHAAQARDALGYRSLGGSPIPEAAREAAARASVAPATLEALRSSVARGLQSQGGLQVARLLGGGDQAHEVLRHDALAAPATAERFGANATDRAARSGALGAYYRGGRGEFDARADALVRQQRGRADRFVAQPIEADQAYTFRREEAEKAMRRAAAAGGTLGGGAHIRGVGRLATQMAGQEARADEDRHYGRFVEQRKADDAARQQLLANLSAVGARDYGRQAALRQELAGLGAQDYGRFAADRAADAAARETRRRALGEVSQTDYVRAAQQQGFDLSARQAQLAAMGDLASRDTALQAQTYDRQLALADRDQRRHEVDLQQLRALSEGGLREQAVQEEMARYGAGLDVEGARLRAGQMAALAQNWSARQNAVNALRFGYGPSTGGQAQGAYLQSLMQPSPMQQLGMQLGGQLTNLGGAYALSQLGR